MAPYTLLTNAASFFARLYLTYALHYIRYLHVLCPALKLKISAVLSLISYYFRSAATFSIPFLFSLRCFYGPRQRGRCRSIETRAVVAAQHGIAWHLAYAWVRLDTGRPPGSRAT